MTTAAARDAAHGFACNLTEKQALTWAQGWTTDAAAAEELANKAYLASCTMADNKETASDELVTFFFNLKAAADIRARAERQGAEPDTRHEDDLAWSAWVIVEQQLFAAEAKESEAKEAQEAHAAL